MADFDPILLALLCTSTLTFVSAGAGLSRVQKTRIVSENSDAYELLDVCAGGNEERTASKVPNCSKCSKCVRTLLTLEALGRLEEFKAVFDLDAYRVRRTELIRPLIEKAYSGDPIAEEAIEFARAQNLALPWYPMPLWFANRGRIRLGRLRRRIMS
jgi:hypothetical protein